MGLLWGTSGGSSCSTIPLSVLLAYYAAIIIGAGPKLVCKYLMSVNFLLAAAIATYNNAEGLLLLLATGARIGNQGLHVPLSTGRTLQRQCLLA